MDTTTTTQQTEGERIFSQARDLLTTIPADDKLAALAGAYVRLMSNLLEHLEADGVVNLRG